MARTAPGLQTLVRVVRRLGTHAKALQDIGLLTACIILIRQLYGMGLGYKNRVGGICRNCVHVDSHGTVGEVSKK